MGPHESPTPTGVEHDPDWLHILHRPARTNHRRRQALTTPRRPPGSWPCRPPQLPTPTGVEHSPYTITVSVSIAPHESPTPTGVEHINGDATAASLLAPHESPTPTGVEHR